VVSSDDGIGNVNEEIVAGSVSGGAIVSLVAIFVTGS
jgi:hypothetical protein